MYLILYNFGNTCYINTAFQCLYNTTSFRSFIQDNSEASELLRNIYLFSQLCKKSDETIILHKWKQIIKMLEKRLVNKLNIFEQNDLCEFVLMILDVLAFDTQTKMTNVQAASIKAALMEPFDYASSKYVMSKSLGHLCANKWVTTYKDAYSDMVNTFNSMLVSQIKCGSCGTFHKNFETHSCLQLDVHDSIEVSIMRYMQPTFFNNDVNHTSNIEWKCDVCNQNTKSKRVTTFWRLADVLLIFLKRFAYNNSGNVVKLDSKVNVPHTIDMNKYVFHHFHSTVYKLSSIGCYMGNANRGHYFALVNRRGKWIKIDDESESNVDENDVLSFIRYHGYMFVYNKQ